LTEVNDRDNSLTIKNLLDDVMDTLSTPISNSPMGGSEYATKVFGVSIDSLMKGDAEKYFTIKKKIKQLSDIYEEARKEADEKPKRKTEDY